jgi:DNA-directed RNA polymerase subunit RPC12/RpoP
MANHVFEWDRKSKNPMIVVCTRCGKRMPLSKVLEIGCKGCPDKVVQDRLGLLPERRDNAER